MKNCDMCKIKDDCRYYYPCELGDKEPLKGDALKSIKDRADAYRKEYLESLYKSGDDMSFYDISDAYIQGATEQKAIDKDELKKKIDDFCEWAYNFHLPNGIAPLYDYVGNMRKKLEE